MKPIIETNPNDHAAMIARLTLGLVIFPHGAQKLLGWFGGYGFTGTMNFLTTQAHLPWVIGLLVILVEFAGSLLLIFGFLTRIAALAMFGNFIGIIITSHIHNGFFMNWSNQPDKGQGFEFHLLVLGLCLACLIAGGGKWSVDSELSSGKGRLAY